MVTPFSIATRLMDYAHSILVSSTGVLTPVATAFHAEEKNHHQERLFVLGGKYCLALALFFCIFFMFLGKPLLTLWMGRAFESSAPLLTILAIGEILPLSQWATTSLILGMGRHKVLALMSLVEVGVGVGLAWVLLRPFGLSGACLGVVFPGTIFRGIGPLYFGCRFLHVSPWEYIKRSLVPPLVAAVIPGFSCALLVHWMPPVTWLEFVSETIFLIAVYGAGAAIPLIGHRQLLSQLANWTRRILGNRKESEMVCQ